MSETTAKWFQLRAKEIGITQSALMAIALNDYMKQDVAINEMPSILEEMKKLQQIKENILSKE